MRAHLQRQFALALVAAGLFAINPVFAEKPDWAGHGKPDKGARDGRGGDVRGDRRGDRGDVRLNMYFGDRQRAVVREYYQDSFRRGNCPPGLAKKHNGCMPPGQARKWQVGRPLPRDVTYYDLPPEMVVRIGLPPAGYKYVRVAGDILMNAAVTGKVVDAINDLGRR